MISNKYLVFILLIGISISILAGQELNQLSIVGKAIRATGEIVPGDKLDANKNQAALVSFITDLDVDMDFRPWNGAVGKITNPAMGRWNVYVSPGERAIDVHAEGFEPLKVVLASFGINSVKSGDVYHLKLTGEKKAEQIPVVITSNQSGANVFIDGELQGTTQNRMLTVNVNQGERKIKIGKDGFARQEITEEISMSNNSFHFNLVPAMPAVVKITSDPEGAIVTIDGNMKMGVTPLESFYDAGTYAIRIEKENYETINEQITIIEPETTKNYKMTDIRATLTIKTHKNATVKFNGIDYEGGIDKFVMLPQTISFMIEQVFCETIEETYSLKKEENKVFELYPEDISASLTIKTNPEASVMFNGERYKGGVDKLIMLPQTISLSIEQEFCETIEETYTLQKGEKKILELYPEDISASLTITTNPEATVIFQRERYKGGIDKLVLLPQTISFKIEQEWCETIKKTYTLAKKEEKVFELYPEDISAKLTIKTHANATVKFNGKEYKGGIDNLVLLSQTISFKIEQEWCETIEETYTLKKGEKKVFELYPEDIAAILTVKTNANATVKFKGESYMGGFSNKKVAPQVLEIEVTMPKAETLKRVIALKPKAEETIEMYPEVQSGVIQVICIPSGAEIELLGDAGEHYTSTGRKTFTDMPIGKYELIVSIAGYKTHKEELHLTADETISKQIPLEERSDRPEMVFVEGGTFQMGSTSGDIDEKPVHSVTLSDFNICKYEVTQGEYEAVMGTNPSKFKKSGKDAPVEKVSWYDAVEYCNKLSDQEGLDCCYSDSGNNIKCDFNANGYRLPTESEWEFAARGGNKSIDYQYSGSNDPGQVAWYEINSGKKTHSVAGKQANELGIFDMSGNVWEWCWDMYGAYSSGTQNNPRGSSSGSRRVSRGGSWCNRAGRCKLANRDTVRPVDTGRLLGFRIACSSK